MAIGRWSEPLGSPAQIAKLISLAKSSERGRQTGPVGVIDLCSLVANLSHLALPNRVIRSHQPVRVLTRASGQGKSLCRRESGRPTRAHFAGARSKWRVAGIRSQPASRPAESRPYKQIDPICPEASPPPSSPSCIRSQLSVCLSGRLLVLAASISPLTGQRAPLAAVR